MKLCDNKNTLIWLDVTTSHKWQGTPVGIVRTEHEFAKRFMKLDNVRFCEYKSDGWFVLDIKNYRSQNVENVQEHQPKLPISTQAKFKSSLLKIFNLVFSGVLQPFRDPVKLIAKGSFQFAKVIFVMFKNQVCSLKTFNSTSGIMLEKLDPISPFKKDDIYITMGLDWNDKDLSLLYKLKSRLGFKVVSVCYDLIPFYKPHFVVPFYENVLSKFFVDMAWGSDLVMSISRSTQNDWIKFTEKYCHRTVKSSYFYLGGDIYEREIVPPKHNRPFCLAVGTIEPRKNYEMLYKVWEILVEKHGKTKVPRLVIVGRGGWKSGDLISLITENPNTQGMIDLWHSVSDAELMGLYGSCLFTLFPSFYEGWGLPIVESLSVGKLCVCSDTSSMLEASQGLALHISPYDFKLWYETVERLIFNPTLLKEHSEKIVEQYKSITWDDSFNEFCEKVRESL